MTHADAPAPDQSQARIQFRLGTLRSASGDLALYSALPWKGDDRPVVVLLHGAMRWASVLTPWAADLHAVADVLLVDLPGHGRSDPITPATVDNLAAKVWEGLRTGLPGRRLLLAGESLGGLIALTIGGWSEAEAVKAVFAADPPMTTKKLFNVAKALQSKIADHPESPFWKALAFDTFGLGPEKLEERIYYPVLEALRVPAIIARGDFALFASESRRDARTLFDGVDHFIASQFYGEKLDIREIPDAGHLLMVDQRGPCLAMVRELLRDHLGGDLDAA